VKCARHEWVYIAVEFAMRRYCRYCRVTQVLSVAVELGLMEHPRWRTDLKTVR